MALKRCIARLNKKIHKPCAMRKCCQEKKFEMNAENCLASFTRHSELLRSDELNENERQTRLSEHFNHLHTRHLARPFSSELYVSNIEGEKEVYYLSSEYFMWCERYRLCDSK